MALGLFFISIFIVIFYRTGRNALLRSLFQIKVQNQETEEFLPAHVISFGTLISIIILVFGFCYTGLQLYMEQNATQHSDLFLFISNLTGGVQILLGSGIWILIVLLILAFMFFWKNGYYFVVSRILRVNEKIVSPMEYTSSQKIVARIFFILAVTSFILIILGIIWAIADAFVQNGKWQSFLNYPISTQITILAAFSAGIFLLLIVVMFFYRMGNNFILKMLYYRIPVPESGKGYMSAKILAAGILISIFFIILALIAWIFSQYLKLFITQAGPENFFEDTYQLSGGLTLLSFSAIAAIFILLILSFVYIAHNGYILMRYEILNTQDKLDKHLAMESKIKIKKE